MTYSYGVWKRRVQVFATVWKKNAAGMWEAGPPEAFSNLIVDIGLDLFAASIGSNAVNTQITHVALGSDATGAGASDTTLGAEEFRKQITAYTTGLATGEVTTTSYIGPAEANTFTINEVGWFVGATAAADSGTLVARTTAYTKTKTNQEAIQIDRVDTFT